MSIGSPDMGTMQDVTDVTMSNIGSGTTPGGTSSMWQVKYEYEYLYAYYPSVIICPTRGTLLVDDKSLDVVALTGGGGSTQDSFESFIVSKFDGLEYGNLYQLENGQVWEQVESWIWIWVWVNPRVPIWNDGGVYRMKVENIDHAVAVRRVSQ